VASGLKQFQRVERREADREAALHASQPGEARAGGRTLTVGVEQLSELCLRRVGSVQINQSDRKLGDKKTRGQTGRFLRFLLPHMPPSSAFGRPRQQGLVNWGTSRLSPRIHHEDVSVVDPGNVNATMETGDSSTNAAGQFLDSLALLGTSALPSNACSIVKQSFTATGNSSPIRVNCLRYGSTDVTITDVTSNPGTCTKPTYHCN
jgi:hypothetical protein